MAVVLKGECDDINMSSCENPVYPSWTWRFNRNQHMTHYTPWQTREEQWPPNYRNMGMHRNFRFHPMGPNDGPAPLLQMGVNFCHELRSGRKTGFGNGALGRSPGPAPPRLFTYGHKSGADLYAINEVNPITSGISLLGHQPIPNTNNIVMEDDVQPLNPCHYFDQTMGQLADVPGSFPQFNKHLPSTSLRPGRECPSSSSFTYRDPLGIWRERYVKQQARHVMERCCHGRLTSSDSDRFP